jgi:hypothetical protein
MKSFRELSRTKKIVTIAAGLLAGGIFIFDDQESEFAQSGGYPAAENTTYPVNSQPEAANATQTSYANQTTAQGRVEIYDQGLQMPIGSYTLPEGWRLVQDIAINPSTNQPVKYKLDMMGPQGEFIRALGTTQYGTMVGKSFEQSWKQLVIAGLQGELEQISFGTLEPDRQAQRKMEENKVYQRIMSQGTQVQCTRVSLSGRRNGHMFEGMVQLTYTSNSHMFGTVTAVSAIGPAGKLAQLMQTKTSIDNSFQMNPAYEQRREQIQQQVMYQNNVEHNQRMAGSRAAHQQRMADQQASFNAHQQRMGEMSQINDANNARWMENFRNSGSYNASGNTGYSSHDAYIDQIYEQSTFNDPYSGQDVQLEGQYDYNYTNGLGDYYQTNDPSFDPHSLQGDWQQTEPLSPNY